MRLSVFALLLLVVFAGQSHAKPQAKSPHDEGVAVPGIIVGTLSDGKAPLAGHAVRLEILHGDELALTINKTTDEKGIYQFKNIFQTPEFSYAVSAEHEGKNYRTQFASLKEGQGTLKLDLMVGGAAPEGPPLPDVADSGSGQRGYQGGTEGGHIHKEPSGEYKLLAVVLGICAAIYAFRIRKRA